MAASLFFYGWGRWSNLWLIGGSLVFNYVVGTQLGRMAAGERKTRWVMALGGLAACTAAARLLRLAREDAEQEGAA